MLLRVYVGHVGSDSPITSVLEMQLVIQHGFQLPAGVCQGVLDGKSVGQIFDAVTIPAVSQT